MASFTASKGWRPAALRSSTLMMWKPGLVRTRPEIWFSCSEKMTFSSSAWMVPRLRKPRSPPSAALGPLETCRATVAKSSPARRRLRTISPWARTAASCAAPAPVGTGRKM